MKLCVISDTHGEHNKLSIPYSDVLIHCGDFTNVGKQCEIDRFIKWFDNQPHKHKIVISGNHEKTLCPIRNNNIPDIDWKGIRYLQDTSVTIDDVVFYGSPWCGGDDYIMNNWGFFDESRLNTIPDNVDILITHSPPYGCLDLYGTCNLGSKVLANRIHRMDTKPIAHFFGHIHDSYGILETDYTTYHNCSNMDKNHNISNPVTIFTI